MCIEITENAARRIRDILEMDARPGAFFRIMVEGGGCQGFHYAMSVSEREMEGDVTSQRDGAVVVVDGSSAPFIAGGRLDWTSDLTGERFRIDNPRAVSSCGCGSSFSA